MGEGSTIIMGPLGRSPSATKSWCEPDRTRVRSYEAKIEPGSTLVEGPLQAESFPVSVEKQYVVVEV